MAGGVNYSNGRGTGVVTADNFAIGDSKRKSVAVLPVYSAISTVTLAQLNAGKSIIDPIAGRKIKVVGFLLKFNGAFLTSTDIRLQDTNTVPVVVTTALIAAATDGAKISSDAVVSNVTDGAGLFSDLTVGKGLSIVKTGTAATGGTSILVKVLYNII